MLEDKTEFFKSIPLGASLVSILGGHITKEEISKREMDINMAGLSKEVSSTVFYKAVEGQLLKNGFAPACFDERKDIYIHGKEKYILNVTRCDFSDQGFVSIVYLEF